MTIPNTFDLECLAYVAEPATHGVLRREVEDFQVTEVLGFEPDGDGRHQLLQVQKRDATTQQVAAALARFAGLPIREIGFSGLKDKRAVATQWFSVPVLNRELSWDVFAAENWRVIHRVRHGRKLRRGSHRSNRFRIIARDLRGDLEQLGQALARTENNGAPNYFGPQRFGHDGKNLKAASDLFSGRVTEGRRFQRGLYLSAARAWLFNLVLSQRVDDKTWDQLLPGDMANLDGSRSVFEVTEPDPALLARLKAFDIHPTGPLWGRGDSPSSGGVQRLETKVLAPYRDWCMGLAQMGLKQQRRSLRLHPLDLYWELQDDTFILTFELARGQFATSVLRECIKSTQYLKVKT